MKQTHCQGEFFFKAGKNNCQYRHRGTIDGDTDKCGCPFGDPEFSAGDCTPSEAHGSHAGVGNWNTNGQTCLWSNNVGTGTWFMRAELNQHDCGAVNQGYCDASHSGCNVNLWVR